MDTVEDAKAILDLINESASNAHAREQQNMEDHLKTSSVMTGGMATQAIVRAMQKNMTGGGDLSPLASAGTGATP